MEIFARSSFDAKSRALVVITVVVTQGAIAQTQTHITRGLHAELTPTEIVEARL